ncbi:hypothetical protein [Longimicrobium sp.]|uniref:hypothetical protein n=1 Tax=Longimicrobium sp. TaxID=2029185 RepID=UPI003B3BCF1C
MPFAGTFSDIYELGIKAACQEAGADCERVDEQQFDEGVLERIYNQIAKADIIIAELTGRNANVFYELGYAHALQRRPILIAQQAEEIPFDVKHYPIITYGGNIAQLKRQLKERVIRAVEKHRWKPDLCIEGVGLEDSPEFEFRVSHGMVEFHIDYHPSEQNYHDLSSLGVDLITSDILINENGRSVPMRKPDNRVSHSLRPQEGIDSQNLPGLHKSWLVRLRIKEGFARQVKPVEEFIVKVGAARITWDIRFFARLMIVE